MYLRRWILGGLGSMLLALGGLGCAASGTEAGFQTLFDGSSIEGWEIYRRDDKPIRDDAWSVDGDVLACKGLRHYWFRYAARTFDDFVLRLEYKVARKSNSGVCVRTTKEGDPPYTGFEIQIMDDEGMLPNRYTSGAIYGVVTPMHNASKPVGQWNQMEITADGPLVKVVLNGFKLIDADLSQLTEPRGVFKKPHADLPPSGYICLQDHGSPVWFRNIRIKPL